MRMPILIWLAAASTLPAEAFAARLSIECPDHIALTEKAQSNYPSWETTADKAKAGYFLESARLFDGHPNEMASLAPGKSKRSSGHLVDTWLLPQPLPARGYWVACAYRNSMTLLTKRLPDTVRRCQFTQKMLPSGALAGVESLVCE